MFGAIDSISHLTLNQYIHLHIMNAVSLMCSAIYRGIEVLT